MNKTIDLTINKEGFLHSAGNVDLHVHGFQRR